MAWEASGNMAAVTLQAGVIDLPLFILPAEETAAGHLSDAPDTTVRTLGRRSIYAVVVNTLRWPCSS